jgi:hypothetical protein
LQDVYLCVHGHFYQPPRLNPFTGVIDREPAAAPYHDFNEKIWDECYRPNAELGNFGHMSFDLGPTLASWLQVAHPATLQLITSAARATYERTGHGNALAQAYHHTILPLATSREKRLQIAWGVRDFHRRYGYPPEGLWLPETAADEETLQLLAEHGLAFTVLAPWQAVVEIDTREPYRLDLGGGRSLCVFFYNAALSGDVSFNGDATMDATRFATHDLAAQVSHARRSAGGSQLLLIATDGEVYGHHKKYRDLFLAHLLEVDAPAAGYTLTSLAGYLALPPQPAPVLPSSALRPASSWSCPHGVARWDEGCACTPGDSSWKRPLRRALRRLAISLDALFEAESAGALRHPWRALESYLDLRDGAVPPATYWSTHAQRRLRTADELRLGGLLEMQLMRQAMFVSCAWFFDDLDGLEPRIALAHAHRAITLAARHSGADLSSGFTTDLAASRSARTGRSAADLYLEFAQAVADVA